MTTKNNINSDSNDNDSLSAVPQMSTDTHSAPTTSSPWNAFGVLLGGGFMTLLDVSAVNIALPALTVQLNASSSQLQWIVAAYSLAFGLMLVPAGRLGDVFGRRAMFILGITGFTLSSLACGLSFDANWLILARFAQGAFAAVVNPQVVGLIQQLFSGNDRGKAYGFNGASIGVSTSLGPVLAGLLVSSLPPFWGWRSIFLINLPVGIIVVWKSFRLLPPHVPSATRVRFDAVGVFLMSFTTLLIMLPLIIATEHASLSGAPWWLLGVGAAFWLAFMAWELWRDRHGHVVILPRTLMRTPSFVLGTIVITCYFAGWSGFFVTISLYLQDGLGLAAWQAGMLQLPFALGATISAALSGRLLARWGRPLVIVGLCLALAGMTSMDMIASFYPHGGAYGLMVVALFVGGVGNGWTIAPNQALTLADVPVHSSSTAGSLLQATQRIGTTLSVAALTLAFFVSLPLAARGRAAQSVAETALFSGAFSTALHVTEVGIGTALILAVVDWYRRRSS